MSFINHNFFGGKSPKKKQEHNMVGRPGAELLSVFAQLYCGVMIGMLLFSDMSGLGMRRPVLVAVFSFTLAAYCVIASENSHNKLGKQVFGAFGIASLAAFLVIMLLVLTGYV